MTTHVKHRTITVSGVGIFYREAGAVEAPVLLLLHGFPSSSHQFRYLLPALADRWHVVAPDFPAFGFSACPDRTEYAYTFDHYTDTIETFTRELGLERYALYVHDYGAQIGFRLAIRNPRRVMAWIIQNSEAHYIDGRTSAWSALETYWRDASPRSRDALREMVFTEDGIRREFVEHLPQEVAELIDPDTIWLAWTQIRRPGVMDALLDLHLDYRTNLDLYPKIQDYFREHQPPALILWGHEDQYYTPAAAMAYRRDLPNAQIHLIAGGHWALESHGPEIMQLTRASSSTSTHLRSRQATTHGVCVARAALAPTNPSYPVVDRLRSAVVFRLGLFGQFMSFEALNQRCGGPSVFAPWVIDHLNLCRCIYMTLV